MSTALDITLDPAQVIKDVFGTDGERNDLAIGIQNNTKYKLTINYNIEHGTSKNIPDSDIVKSDEVWEGGVKAVGEGSNIALSITIDDGPAFALIAATPSNKENYFKVTSSSSGYSSISKARDAADDKDKQYSSDGYQHETVSDYEMTVSITGSSPAACTAVISES